MLLPKGNEDLASQMFRRVWGQLGWPELMAYPASGLGPQVRHPTLSFSLLLVFLALGQHLSPWPALCLSGP